MNLSEYPTLTQINNFEYSGYSFNRAVWYSKANVPKGYVFGIHMAVNIPNGIDDNIRGNYPTRLRLVYRQSSGTGIPFLEDIACIMQIMEQSIVIEVGQFRPVYFSGETSQLQVEVDNIALTDKIHNLLSDIGILVWMWAK